jgi:hypothetical protein
MIIVACGAVLSNALHPRLVESDKIVGIFVGIGRQGPKEIPTC